jgi:hypothetical protein
MRVAAIALLASLGIAASGSALAGKSFSGNVGAAVPSAPPAASVARPSHGHSHQRVFVGGAVGFGYPWGWWYPPPYYYYYPVPGEPVSYIEQGDAAPAAERWWYYCESSTSYYPYVRECPAGWERVPPR